MECLPLWPSYIHEKGEDFWAKHMGLKQGVIGNSLGEHIGNLGNILVASWEPIGNLKGTKEKFKKILPSPAPHPPKKLQRKKIKAL